MVFKQFQNYPFIDNWPNAVTYHSNRNVKYQRWKLFEIDTFNRIWLDYLKLLTITSRKGFFNARKISILNYFSWNFLRISNLNSISTHFYPHLMTTPHKLYALIFTNLIGFTSNDICDSVFVAAYMPGHISREFLCKISKTNRNIFSSLLSVTESRHNSMMI